MVAAELYRRLSETICQGGTIMRAMLVFTATACCCLSSTADAQRADTGGFTPMIEFSAGVGGDTLAELTFTDGSSQDINAGDGLTVSAGLIQRVSEKFRIKYTLGYKFSTSAAENLDVWKSVIPVDVLPFYQSGNHRFGAGLTYHISPQLDIDDFGTVKFDDAPGFIVEYGYKAFSLAYTGVDYDINGASFDASNIMLRFALGF